MICLTLTESTLNAALARLETERAHIDSAELRADLLNRGERAGIASFPARVAAIEELADLPLLLTARRTQDGGAWADEEEHRLALLADSSQGFAYVDIEDDCWEHPRARGIREAFRGTTVRSIHDLSGVPDDLPGQIRRMAGANTVAKLAVTPGGTADLARIIDACNRTKDLRRIVLGIGDFGVPTRILSGRLGNELTFASAPGASAARGHLTPAELAERYRYRALTARTSLFAVIGNPVMHSKSPEYHNSAFARANLDACYLPILVDDVASLFALAESLPIAGFSVTIPHKQTVIAHLDVRDAAVEAVGACNTVLRREARWVGTNTDVEGFWRPLERRMVERFAHHGSGLRALIVGAGGASRAAAFALARAGVKITIANRTVARARALAVELGLPDATAVELESIGPDWLRSRGPERPLIIVQTTSVGMAGGDPLPSALVGDEIVYDMVYTPPVTPLLDRARRASCTVISGSEMFEAQARAQSELFSALVR